MDSDLTKVLGTGFALESARRGVSFAISADPTGTLYETLGKIWRPTASKLRDLNYPISRPVTEITKLTIDPAFKKLTQLWEADVIGSTTFGIGSYLLFAIAPIATGLVAKYLFNKANSYQTEIARLEEEIEKDNTIIIALQNQ